MIASKSIFDKALDILVLMGGPSTEREVSLVSGRAVADVLEACGHRVRRKDISPEDLSAFEGPRPDVVFIAMHGAFGEDGQVQRLCEQRGLPYVGSAPKASATAMDKAAAKAAYRSGGLNTPDWAVLTGGDTPARRKEALARIGLPCALKPVDGGSSVDVSLVTTATARKAAIELLLGKYGKALLEPLIRGRELTVGVLGEQALPPVEIRPKGDFYDYAAKYINDDTEYLFEYGLDAATVQRLQAAALGAHRVLGCRDLSRSDFILDGAGAAWLLETNTIPGFTSHSLLPKSAARIGIPMPRLCEMLVKMALDRGCAQPVWLACPKAAQAMQKAEPAAEIKLAATR
jgi:D-alanine-D-alanine ligase